MKHFGVAITSETAIPQVYTSGNWQLGLPVIYSDNNWQIAGDYNENLYMFLVDTSGNYIVDDNGQYILVKNRNKLIESGLYHVVRDSNSQIIVDNLGLQILAESEGN